MSQPDRPPTPLPATVGMPTSAPATPSGPDMPRQQHLERLNRLFRQSGDSADDRYLRHLMARYREVEPS